MQGSDLCDKTILTIKGLLLTLGEGIPNPGDVFKTGAGLFKNIESKLDNTFPGLDWVGEAAEKYSAQNLAQQLRMKTMGNLDQLTNGFVSNQAEYIKNTRNVLNAMKTMVEGARKACKACETVPILGDIASWAIAAPACALAMLVTGGAMLYLTIMTLNNASNLKQLLPNLLTMLTTLPKLSDLLPGLPDIKLPDLSWPPDFNLPDIKWPEIKIPDFRWPDIPGFPGLPEIKFPDFQFPDFNFPGLPGLPMLPDLFPGLPNLSDLFGGAIPRLPVWSELADLPDFLGGITGLPTLNFSSLLGLANMPTFNQLTSTLSQLTQLTGGAGGMNMLSTVGGQAGGLSSLASAGGAGGGAGPATLVSDVKTDDEEDGAGAGTPGGGRAPVQGAGTGGTSGAGQEGRVL